MRNIIIESGAAIERETREYRSEGGVLEQLLILAPYMGLGEIEQFQSSSTAAYEVIITICTRVSAIMTYLVSRYEAIKLRPLDYNI